MIKKVNELEKFIQQLFFENPESFLFQIHRDYNLEPWSREKDKEYIWLKESRISIGGKLTEPFKFSDSKIDCQVMRQIILNDICAFIRRRREGKRRLKYKTDIKLWRLVKSGKFNIKIGKIGGYYLVSYEFKRNECDKKNKMVVSIYKDKKSFIKYTYPRNLKEVGLKKILIQKKF